MALPDLERWAECWLELQKLERDALAAGAPLALVQLAEASGCVGQTWGRFSLGWARDLEQLGAEVEKLLLAVHRGSRLAALALRPVPPS